MDTLAQRLQSKFGDARITCTTFRGNVRHIVPAAHLMAIMSYLKNDAGFDYLSDIAGIDYLHYPDATDRYGVIYCLANTRTAERCFVKVLLNDPDPTVDSVYPLWKGADWMEREIYDMFGVVFTGHPDLRRILMPEGYASYPLRKDYPLRGHGERHNFETVTRSES